MSPLHWPGYALFLLMLVAPTQFQAAKLGLLGLLGTMILVQGRLVRRPTLHVSVLAWVGVLVLAGLFFVVRGAVRGEPGAVAVSTVFVLWPAVFLVLISGIPARDDVERYVRIVVLGTLLASAYGGSIVLHELGYLPDRLYFQLSEDHAIGIHDGFIELRFDALGTLVFSVPFLVAALFAWRGMERPFVRRAWIWLALIASLTVVLISGRRALVLVVGVAPLATFPFVLLLPAVQQRPILRTMLRVGGVVVLIPVLVFLAIAEQAGLRTDAIWQMFRQGFDPAVSESMGIRAVQLREMMAVWGEHPLLGSGHGAFLPNYIRDLERPWAYELSYGALLFQTGLLGLTVYAGAIAWIYAMAASVIRRGGRSALLMIPVGVGLTSFLGANLTNPYLSKFDFMWVVFLPLAILNSWLLRSEAPADAVAGDGSPRLAADAVPGS